MNQRPEREVVWVGDSKERLKEFPKEAQRHIGHALGYAQHGGKHHVHILLKNVQNIQCFIPACRQAGKNIKNTL
jgi:phage-related protein